MFGSSAGSMLQQVSSEAFPVLEALQDSKLATGTVVRDSSATTAMYRGSDTESQNFPKFGMV